MYHETKFYVMKAVKKDGDEKDKQNPLYHQFLTTLFNTQ